MKKYPLIVMVARKGGPITHYEAVQVITQNSTFEAFFKDGDTMPVMVANVLPTPMGWGFAYIVIRGDIQPTPTIHALALGFNGLGLGEPGDMETFLKGFPEIGYEGPEDPDFQHRKNGITATLRVTPEEFEKVLERFPAPVTDLDVAMMAPTTNRTLH